MQNPGYFGHPVNYPKILKKLRHAAQNNKQRLLRTIERRFSHTLHNGEKPLRFYRMSGLTCEQLDELEERVEALLAEPWVKGSVGRGN